MDEKNYLATIRLLSQSRSLENRLKLMLEATRSFLNLDICSILFVPDSGNDFHMITCDGGPELVQDGRGKYFSAGQKNEDCPGSNIVVLRRCKSEVEQENYGFGEVSARKLRVRSVAGTDFRPHQNLEVRLRLTRSHEQGEFSDAEINLVEKVSVSIRDAITAGIEEQHRAIFDITAQKLLTRLRIGMFILNPQFEILEKSVLANELLEKTRVYYCKENWLAGKAREQQSKLDEALLELNNNNGLSYKIVDVVSIERGEQYTLAIAKTTSHSMFFEEGNFLAFIFSSPGENIDPVDLLSLWQISPAEKKVLAAIARFDNIKKVAIELKISPNTAKAQLKSAYRKLGVGSKMMLMKRLNLLRNIEALMS